VPKFLVLRLLVLRLLLPWLLVHRLFTSQALRLAALLFPDRFVALWLVPQRRWLGFQGHGARGGCGGLLARLTVAVAAAVSAPAPAMLLAFALGRTLRRLGHLLGTRLLLRTWRTRLLVGPSLAAFSPLLPVAPLFEPALLLAIAMLVAPAITSFAALLLGPLVAALLAVAAVLVARRALRGGLRHGLGNRRRGRRSRLGLEQAEDP